MSPTPYPLFPVFAFCSFFLVLIPLPWHIQAWNVGTCAYIFWTSVACLFEFINSVVWNNNVLNTAPVWCDISSKFLLGAGVGIPAAGLCISRRLYTISAIKTTVITTQDRRRIILVDSCIVFGIPVVIMALHYVVQTNRFSILEDVGCWPATYNTLLAYFLVFMWPTVLGCIAFVYSSLTLCAFYKRRLEFTQFLSAHSSFSMNRYIRLMLLAISEMMCTVPISIFSTYIANKDVPIQPWVSWADTHYDFSFVDQIPADQWMTDPYFRISVDLSRWLFPASALLFFLLFGFGTEARKHYRIALLRIAEVFGYKPVSEIPIHSPRKLKADFNKTISVGSLPVYVPAPAHIKNSKPLVSSMVKPDIDIEKTASYSAPSAPGYLPEDLQLSPTNSRTGGDMSEYKHASTSPSVIEDRCTIPAYHLPFRLPGIPSTPERSVHEHRSLGSVCITVHTEYSSD